MPTRTCAGVPGPGAVDPTSSVGSQASTRVPSPRERRRDPDHDQPRRTDIRVESLQAQRGYPEPVRRSRGDAGLPVLYRACRAVPVELPSGDRLHQLRSANGSAGHRRSPRDPFRNAFPVPGPACREGHGAPRAGPTGLDPGCQGFARGWCGRAAPPLSTAGRRRGPASRTSDTVRQCRKAPSHAVRPGYRSCGSEARQPRPASGSFGPEGVLVPPTGGELRRRRGARELSVRILA